MDRLAALQKELAELRDEFNAKKAKWQNEKSAVDKVSKLRENIESTKNEIKSAQQNYDLEKAAELQYGVLPNLQKELEIEEQKIKDKDLSLVRENVSDEEIAKIISRWTGIPVCKAYLKVRGIKHFILMKNSIRELSDRMMVLQRSQRQ